MKYIIISQEAKITAIFAVKLIIIMLGLYHWKPNVTATNIGSLVGIWTRPCVLLGFKISFKKIIIVFCGGTRYGKIAYKYKNCIWVNGEFLFINWFLDSHTHECL